MGESGSQGLKPWDIYRSSDPSPSQAGIDREATSKSFGTSMNAISFGFVATAILISMFLIMAIFEHLFRPSSPFSSPEDTNNNSLESGRMHKLKNTRTVVTTTYAADFPVVMPGQHYPTYIAQPAPLPCHREAIHWPPHEHTFVCS